jgi:hypothetical protein
LNLGSRLLSSKFFYHQNYIVTIVLDLVLCKINDIWHITYSNSNIIFKNQNSKFNLMKFWFEFLNFHVSHLTQLGMINITFKCHKKNICKKVHNFHHCSTWFLALFFVLSPNFHMRVSMKMKKHSYHSKTNGIKW